MIVLLYLSVDTAFMYMIGCLIMVKIYQTRHPDVNAHAHSAYCFIALIVFMGVMGVVSFAVISHLCFSCKSVHMIIKLTVRVCIYTLVVQYC